MVYGPQTDADKVLFLDELATYGDRVQLPWLAYGDFNMIYRASDKNNQRLDRRCMTRFRRFLNRMQLEEINMRGRLYSWSNERDNPTLELLDRVFGTAGWFVLFPHHALPPLSTDYSDHCPLLLQLNAFGRATRRFHFEPFWAKLPGPLTWRKLTPSKGSIQSCGTWQRN